MVIVNKNQYHLQEGFKMKRKLLAVLCAAAMVASMGTTVFAADAEVKATGDEKIALITMDSIDQHWITLNEGAQKAAEELGVTVDFMSPNTKDDAQQIECVNNAVAGGYNAIKAGGNPDIIGVGFDKSDAILNLITDGHLLATMAQNPDVMGYEGVKAAVRAINGEDLGGEVTDTGVSVLDKAAVEAMAAEEPAEDAE